MGLWSHKVHKDSGCGGAFRILWSQDAHWTYDVGFLTHRAPCNCFCKGILWDDSHACHTVKAAHVLVSSQRHFRSSDDGTILLQRALLQLWWWERFACKQFLLHLCNSFLVRVSYMYFLYSSRFFNNKYSSSSHLYPQDTHKIPIGYSQAVFPSPWSLSKDLFCTPIVQKVQRSHLMVPTVLWHVPVYWARKIGKGVKKSASTERALVSQGHPIDRCFLDWQWKYTLLGEQSIRNLRLWVYHLVDVCEFKVEMMDSWRALAYRLIWICDNYFI